MATARRLPSGNYRIRVYAGKDENGKDQYKSITAQTKKEAERRAAVYEYEADKKKKDGLTVGEAIDLYIKNGDHILSPASIRKYDSMRRNNYSGIEDRYVSGMTKSAYQAFVNEISQTYSPKSVASICGLLTAALKSYDESVNLSLKRPKLQNSAITIPTDAQVKKMIEGAGSAEMRLAFVMGAALGMRRSEICALTWGDIEGDVIHITKAMVQDKKNQWVIKGTKTNAGTRDMDIPDHILSMLESIKPPEAKQEDRIFPFTPSAITMRFYRVSRNAGIKCRFHDLRHYNASIMLALGIPDKYAMQRMGHATTHMLKTVYQHVIDDQEKKASEKVNKYMKKLYPKNI